MEVLAKLPPADQRDSELKTILNAIGAFRRGEASVTLPSEWEGTYGKIAAEFNELSVQAGRISHKLKSIDGNSKSARAGRRLSDDKLAGFWQDDVAVFNALLDEVDDGSEHTRVFLSALTDLKKGMPTAQLPQDWTGVFG